MRAQHVDPDTERRLKQLGDTLLEAREQANELIDDPRERAIIVRYIEDATCRLCAGWALPALTPRVASGNFV